MSIFTRVAKWYTMGVYDASGALWLPIPGYDNLTIVAYGPGEEVSETYVRLIKENLHE